MINACGFVSVFSKRHLSAAVRSGDDVFDWSSDLQTRLGGVHRYHQTDALPRSPKCTHLAVFWPQHDSSLTIRDDDGGEYR